MWTSEHDATVSDFLSSSHTHRLLIYVDAENCLCIKSTFSPTKLDELVYFIRDANAATPQITCADFESRIRFGRIEGVTMDSLLRLMNSVYIPVLSGNNAWPESIQKQFTLHLNKFMAFLTDSTHQMKGFTVLYVPKEAVVDVQAVAKNKDQLQRYESLLVHWTRQIKEVINNQRKSESADNSGPLEEIEFWKRRCLDLSGISDQLQSAEAQKIVAVLECAKSSYLAQFLRLSTMIQDGSLQAQENLKFLTLLREPCQELLSADLKAIPNIYPHILNCIRLVWSRSHYYNSKEQITSLLRKVSNEIIQRCISQISLPRIFAGDVEASIKTLNNCIECGDQWRAHYRTTCNQIAKYSDKTWDYDQSSIFAQIDAFVQRCRDMLEICECQLQFTRKLWDESAQQKKSGGSSASADATTVAIPLFGGSNGPEITKRLSEIEVAFDRELQNLWSMKDLILDVKATRWHDEFNSFKQVVKYLEVMMQNVITSVFESALTVESQVALLDTFYFLSKKDSIRRAVEKKLLDVHQCFLQELNVVKVEFDQHRKAPEIFRFHADFSGSAFWARFLLRRIKQPMECLQSISLLFPPTSVSLEVANQYEPLALALEDFVIKTHAEWTASISPTIHTRLDSSLMAKSGDKTLEMRFDPNLSRLLAEVCWPPAQLRSSFYSPRSRCGRN